MTMRIRICSNLNPFFSLDGFVTVQTDVTWKQDIEDLSGSFKLNLFK